MPPKMWCLAGLLGASVLVSCAPRPREGGRRRADKPKTAPLRPLDPKVEAQHKKIWGGGISRANAPKTPNGQERPSSKPLAPIEAELTGLDGAAQRLGVGAMSQAMAMMDGIEPGTEPEHQARVYAIRGRLALWAGDYKLAITAYQALLEKELRDQFPSDIAAYFLAQAHLRLAEEDSLPGQEKAEHRAQTVQLLAQVMQAPETRLRAAAQVERALALTELSGEAGSASSLTALKELQEVLDRYPNHPRVRQIALHRALAMETAGQMVASAQALRDLAMRYAGSAVAKTALQEYRRLAEQSRAVTMEPFSFDENLRRAKAAREQRYVLWSRELLDDLFASAKSSRDRQSVARQRSWTAYYQRDFAQCVKDVELLPRGEQVSEYFSLYNRCLERGEEYDKAVAQAKSVARRGKSTRTRRKALWKVVDLALRGGLYQKARAAFGDYSKLQRRSSFDDKWTSAWIAYREGRWASAAREMGKLTRRSGTDGDRARYYAAKISKLRGGASRVRKAYQEWQALAREEPFTYYGLMAREQLLQAGQKVPEPPSLLPADPEVYPTFEEVSQRLAQSAEQFGQAMPSITRLSQLYRVGYFEEARRELRWLSDQYLYNRAKVNRSRFLRPRDEGAVVGLSWAPKFSMPKPPVTSQTRAILANASQSSQLQESIRIAAVALREHYRVAKHADSSSREYLSRWLLRAYRSVVEREAERYNIDASRLWALMYTESRFRRHVVSYVGARGALQIMPWTGRQLEQRLGIFEKQFNPDSLFDVRYNLKLAAYYVSELIQKFQGQAPLAYASYNGGPSNVARWVQAKAKAKAKIPLELDDFIEEIPFGETYRYTKRVMEVDVAYRWMYEKQMPRWDLRLPEDIGDNIEF